MPSLADLIRMGKQYIGDAMPGGSLNPETAPVARQANYLSGILDPASQVSQDATNWHKRTQIGLKDQLAGRQTPEAEQAYQTMMMAAGMAPIGMTAWHGSPHKFDKFSLDKIGTGEGAQAYGHGLYLAEKPEIAAGYRERLSTNYIDNSGAQKAAGDAWTEAMQAAQDAGAKHPDHARAIAAQVQSWVDSGKQAKTFLRYNQPPAGTEAQYKAAADALNGLKKNPGNLYKTDIPDEAVARFLDWDKPLSQQAPEVQAALQKMDPTKLSMYVNYGWPLTNPADAMKETGSRLYEGLGKGKDWNAKLGIDERRTYAAQVLQDMGIPGIRYLDGGSRSAGQGSSNFVAFDPEMIRILERNGQATGLEPWKPGEYRLKDLIGKE